VSRWLAGILFNSWVAFPVLINIAIQLLDNQRQPPALSIVGGLFVASIDINYLWHVVEKRGRMMTPS